MLHVHAPGRHWTFATDRQALNAGNSYELYVYRAPRFIAAGIASLFVLGSAAFLVYALFADIPDLWIYATVSLAVTSFLTALALYLTITLNYERISLAGNFAHAYACQHSLLVISGKDGTEGWFAAGFVLFIQDREAHLYASADFRKVDPASLKDPGLRAKSKMAVSLQRRSFIQTDSTDLRDYLRCVALKNQLLLARKAKLVGARG